MENRWRRFIPVLTGNTIAIIESIRSMSVYPRTYGEHTLDSNAGSMNGGLSPYLRGTLRDGGQKKEGKRFIPVLTGNTPPVLLMRCQKTVYPRTYGEHAKEWGLKGNDVGLSPYLRGTLHQIIGGR
ncbi:conserved hypothetical protein [Xenorhabdus nematophila str. Websteri]|nr:conserved hypothetical protein [Xenorhabdus nematophila str. Websteri]